VRSEGGFRHRSSHKSDVGGVRLDVTDGESAFRSIVDSVRAAVSGADVMGVVVTPMAGRGIELIVGATADPIFGPVVAFGSGGMLVEARGDVTFRAAPFTRLEAMEMIDETAASKVLDGYRGLPKVDRERLATSWCGSETSLPPRHDFGSSTSTP
jgi:acetyltransferase